MRTICVLVVLLADALPAFSQAQPTNTAISSRGTLFQWSYGTSFSGGPDLTAPLATDRPDFTEASSTVGRRVLQIESGYTYSRDRNQSAKSVNNSYPETLFRYGILADWLELRVAQNFSSQTGDAVSSNGAEDLYLGFKIGLTPQEGILPEMALVPQMTVPSGAEDFSSGKVLAGVNWLYGWDVVESISTAGSTQFNQSIDEQTARAYTEWAQSWTIGYTLTEKLGGYTEWFAIMPSGADSALTQHYFNGGLFYQFTHDIQWDVRSGVGLSDASDDSFFGTGLSLRFH